MNKDRITQTSIWRIGRNVARKVGIRDFCVHLYVAGKKHHARQKEERRHRQFVAGLDRGRASSKLTAVVLTCDPNHLFERCLTSVHGQNLPEGRVEVVRNVTPVSRAEQTALDLVSTPYYISVDGDMVLKPTCFERMYSVMSANADCGRATTLADDPILGMSSSGCKLYRTEPAKAIGFHPVREGRDHDRVILQEMGKMGLRDIIVQRVEAEHHPEYRPHEAFWKFKTNAEKARYYGDRNPSFRMLLGKIVDFWERTHDDVALYALAGLFQGLQSEDIEQELTYEGRLTDAAYCRVASFLGGTNVPLDRAADESSEDSRE